MATIDTLFFDWGGVIADDPGDEFLGRLLRQIGANEAQIQEIHTSYMRDFMRGDISESEYWQLLRDNYGFAIHESISDDFVKWRGLIVNEDIMTLVDQAKASGLQTAILSNVIEPTYNVLVKAGHYDRFDAVIASCQVGFAKPQAEIYQLALEQLHTQADRSVFIDDKQANIDIANQLGFKTVLAQNPAQIIADVSRYFL